MNVMEIRRLRYNKCLLHEMQNSTSLYIGLHSKPQGSYPLSVTWATIRWWWNWLHGRRQGYSCHQQQFPIPAQGTSSQLHHIWSPALTRFNQPTNSPGYHASLAQWRTPPLLVCTHNRDLSCWHDSYWATIKISPQATCWLSLHLVVWVGSQPSGRLASLTIALGRIFECWTTRRLWVFGSCCRDSGCTHDPWICLWYLHRSSESSSISCTTSPQWSSRLALLLRWHVGIRLPKL
jgi:hypothetical protein